MKCFVHLLLLVLLVLWQLPAQAGVPVAKEARTETTSTKPRGRPRGKTLPAPKGMEPIGTSNNAGGVGGNNAGTDAETATYSLREALADKGINPNLALLILLAIIMLRFDLMRRLQSFKWSSPSFWGMIAIFAAAGVAIGVFVPFDGIYSILTCIGAGFAFFLTIRKRKYDRFVANALILVMLFSVISVPHGFGNLLWIGVGFAIFVIYDTIVNVVKSRRRRSCLAKLVAWKKKRGIEDETLPITSDSGETFCIVGLDDEKQMAVDVDCRPNKQGYYKCAWVWNDPKDGEVYFTTPDNYKILFNPETGDFKESDKDPCGTESNKGDGRDA